MTIYNGLGQVKLGWKPSVQQYNYLLNTYSGASVGHSMFKLKSSYTGYCLRVRRTSDNTSQDIGFVNNYIDVASMLSFVGSGDGYVSIWYDQVGSNNYVQNTAANQPQIVFSGMTYLVNGNVVIKGSITRYLTLSNAVVLTISGDPYNASWWLSYHKDTQASQAVLVGNNINYLFLDYGTTQNVSSNASLAITIGSQYSKGTLRLMNGDYNRTGSTKTNTLYANNTSLGSNSITAGIFNFGSTQYLPYTNVVSGNIYFNEFVLFQSSSTIDRSGINTSISNRILTGTPTTTAYDSLTNYYSGDSTTNDKKGSSNGTIVGSVTYAAGKNNNDFSINGSNNNYVSLPTNFFKPTGSFTFNGWIKTSNQTSTQTLFTITDSSGYLGFRVFISSNAVVFRTFPVGTTTNELTTTTYTSVAQYSTSDYSMITAVNDINNGMRIYVNGLLIGANTTKQAISWGTTSINRIGANWDGGTTFNGLIGEIGLFNSALSNYQIDELYKNGAGKFY